MESKSEESGIGAEKPKRICQSEGKREYSENEKKREKRKPRCKRQLEHRASQRVVTLEKGAR